MEDYIFLIIAVVISIFAAINKNKKNKMAELTPEDEEEEVKRRNYFMDQLLGEDFLEEKDEMQEPPMRVQTTPSKVVYKSTEDARKGLNYKLPRFKSTLPDRPKHVSIASSPRKKALEELQEEPEQAVDYLEDFSLRKAVVYSIILEPKYEMES